MNPCILLGYYLVPTVTNEPNESRINLLLLNSNPYNFNSQTVVDGSIEILPDIVEAPVG